MKNEPAVTVASITSAVTAAIVLFVAFGGNLSKEQTVAILGVVTVVAPFLVGLIVRSKVVPVAKVATTNPA